MIYSFLRNQHCSDDLQGQPYAAENLHSAIRLTALSATLKAKLVA
jgi:hypothetical protein